MSTVFLVCLLLGGAILVLQLVLGLLGLGHDLAGLEHDGDFHGDHAGDALNLLSVRALSAGLAFFGLAGYGMMAAGWLAWLALPVALAAGFAAAALVAFTMRQLRKLEADGTVRLERAVGEPATVYLGIGADMAQPGKIQMTLQGRIVEFQAVSRHALPTGAQVVVVDVVGPDTVEVAPSPPLGGPFDALE